MFSNTNTNIKCCQYAAGQGACDEGETKLSFQIDDLSSELLKFWNVDYEIQYVVSSVLFQFFPLVNPVHFVTHYVEINYTPEVIYCINLRFNE